MEDVEHIWASLDERGHAQLGTAGLKGLSVVTHIWTPVHGRG